MGGLHYATSWWWRWNFVRALKFHFLLSWRYLRIVFLRALCYVAFVTQIAICKGRGGLSSLDQPFGISGWADWVNLMCRRDGSLGVRGGR